uniref:Uncharacterized protein n=1 Tax=Candidatus Kentrum sp. FW TaxID=2126338 RepID=A0A450SJH7_9GAMM|nr:MAG: hypothetical protein BECKFW1821B_GA0114236_101543 [Candidatus Kentron sp. FW]
MLVYFPFIFANESFFPIPIALPMRGLFRFETRFRYPQVRYLQVRQKLGDKITNSVKISRRPNSMARHKIHLAVSLMVL